MSHEKKLTTNAGALVVDNQNMLTAGKRGPQLLQDVWFLEARPREVQMRHIDNRLKADPAYGARVAKALGIERFEPQAA